MTPETQITLINSILDLGLNEANDIEATPEDTIPVAKSAIKLALLQADVLDAITYILKQSDPSVPAQTAEEGEDAE